MGTGPSDGSAGRCYPWALAGSCHQRRRAIHYYLRCSDRGCFPGTADRDCTSVEGSWTTLEGYHPRSGTGWRWTETWLRAHFQGDGLLAEISEEEAQEIIGRWEQKEYGKERVYYARLWYTPGPGRQAQETLSPLLRRSTDLSRLEMKSDSPGEGGWLLRRYRPGSQARARMNISR
jgi:hypothetical protein